MKSSLLIFFELVGCSDEVYYTIVNSIGRGYHYCKMDNSGRTELWMIPKTRKEKDEITTQLKALKSVRNLCVVVIVNSAKAADSIAVRELFQRYGWDASAISDDELLMYLNSVFQLENAYSLTFNQPGTGPCQVSIKPAIENPYYSASANDRIKKWMLDEKEIIPGNRRSVLATSTQMVSVRKVSPAE